MLATKSGLILHIKYLNLSSLNPWRERRRILGILLYLIVSMPHQHSIKPTAILLDPHASAAAAAEASLDTMEAAIPFSFPLPNLWL
jgi:hypothetical protein